MYIDNLDRFLIQGCRLPLCNILYQLLSLIYLDSPRWPHIYHLPRVVVLFPLFHLHTIFLFFYKNPLVSTFFKLLSTKRAISPSGGTRGIFRWAVTLETIFGISRYILPCAFFHHPSLQQTSLKLQNFAFHQLCDGHLRSGTEPDIASNADCSVFIAYSLFNLILSV